MRLPTSAAASFFAPFGNDARTSFSSVEAEASTLPPAASMTCA
jgi:hypothetical protein